MFRLRNAWLLAEVVWLSLAVAMRRRRFQFRLRSEAEAAAVPWVKPHTVPHLPTDCTAMLKLIETRFHVPALTQRDATLPPAI